MGKKSITDSQLRDTSLSPESKRTNIEQSMDGDGETEDLRELITQEVLKVALQAELQDRKGTQDAYNQVVTSSYSFFLRFLLYPSLIHFSFVSGLPDKAFEKLHCKEEPYRLAICIEYAKLIYP